MNIHQGGRTIKISDGNRIYAGDIIASFDYYFKAVEPTEPNFVDYSEPREHIVPGFGPAWFPSLAEPLQTAQQYLDFAQLKEGQTVLDLGAYAGLTSILFKRAVGAAGTVVAVEPDDQNMDCARKNIGDRYDIQLTDLAVWSSNGVMNFSSERCMGSTMAHFVANWRGITIPVRTGTLSDLANQHDLFRIDFIKCDIEGAETEIFKDRAFFKKFRPKIIIEPHEIHGKLNSDVVIEHLEAINYDAKLVSQIGVKLPLIEALPR
jgi:FkbM family methyltransferase